MPAPMPDPNPELAALATAQITIMDQNDGVTADITTTNITIPTDLAGVPIANAYDDAIGYFTVWSGSVNVTDRADISLSVSLHNVTVSVNYTANTPTAGELKGYFKVTNIVADTGYFEIIATQGEIVLSKRVYVTKSVATESESSGKSTSSLSVNTMTSFAAISPILTVATGANGTFYTSASGYYYGIGNPGVYAAIQYEIKTQYKESSSETWIDFPLAIVQGGTSEYDHLDSFKWLPPPKGSVSISLPQTSVASPFGVATSVDFRLVGRMFIASVYTEHVWDPDRTRVFQVSWSP
jgi:hypothetical protein